jgi:hypothetical protein
MPDLLPCPFCNEIPTEERRYEGGFEDSVRLVCKCGIQTKWESVATYDRKRFDERGPEQEFAGAYYRRDWKKALIDFWNTRSKANA